MDRQPVSADIASGDGFLDELLGELLALVDDNHPADRVAAVDVDHRVEAVEDRLSKP
jgi:hypothetical protein